MTDNINENNNPLHLPLKGSTIERATINVLNTITTDMYDRKVKGIEKNVEDNKVEAKKDIGIEANERKDAVNELADLVIALSEEV